MSRGMVRSEMLLRTLWLMAALLFASHASADDRQVGLDWLKVIAFAAHQMNYSGEFIYQYDNQVETLRITHVVEGDNEYERLERLDGPGYEIVRHNGQVWCDFGNWFVQVDSQQGRSGFPALLPEQLSALNANYLARKAGQERVAGYNAQAILFQPRDSLRYAHKIWAHGDTGLLLKAAVLDDRARTVEQYAFTQLRIGNDIDRSWINRNPVLGGDARSKPAPGVTHEPSANTGWVVDALPAGFRKIREFLRPMHGRQNPVTQIVFSDGLSAISVFIEPAEENKEAARGLTSRGAVNMYRKEMEGRLFTVVGEVPPRTVMQVLDSLRYSGR